MTPGYQDITVETERAELRAALAGLIEKLGFQDCPECFGDGNPNGHIFGCELGAALARAREVLGD